MVQQIRRTSVFNFRILEFFALANKAVTLAEASGSSEAFSDIRREAFGFLMRFLVCSASALIRKMGLPS